jgi:mycothiol system anti-sigma-R factor
MAHDHSDCKEIFARLSEFLDVELPEGDCERIQQHLADCPPCVEFVESLRKSVELCRGYGDDARPAPLSADVRAELERVWRNALRSGK